MFRKGFLFICPLGLVLAIFAHLLLTVHAFVMVLVNGFSVYGLSLLGYFILATILLVKGVKHLRRGQKEPRK